MTKATEAWLLIEPFAQRKIDDALGIVLGGARRGAGGEYPLLLYTGNEIIEYVYSATGMAAAISASASGDTIFQPAGTISGNHTNKSGVTIIGQGENSILSGTITNTGILNNVQVSGALGGVGLRINVILETRSIISGTATLLTNSDYSVIGGGSGSIIDPDAGKDYNVIVGGISNEIDDDGSHSVIVGGDTIEIGGPYCFIGGGQLNEITTGCDKSVVVGGLLNIITISAAANTRWNFIGGGQGNRIQDAQYCFIGGGVANLIDGDAGEQPDSTISGGNSNSILISTAATIGGGDSNDINDADYATIPGGDTNAITGSDWALIGGGKSNVITTNSDYCFIGGGFDHTITDAVNATIVGGEENDIQAGADFSFAQGSRCQITHLGAMLFSDTGVAVFPSAANNEFAVRASGGFRLVSGGTFKINTNGVVDTPKGRIMEEVDVIAAASPFSILATHHIIFCNTTDGAIEVDLPAGVDGTNYKIVNTGSAGNDVTVDPNANDGLLGAGNGVASTLADGEVIDIHFSATRGWWGALSYAAGVNGEIPLVALADYTRGDLIIGGAADWEDLAVGGAGAILKTDGTDVAWTTALVVDANERMTIPVATATTEALILQTTDDNTTKNLFETQDSGGTASSVFTSVGNLELPATTSTVGQILQNGNRFIHSFGTDNVFLGNLAGNLSTSGTGRNVGIGFETLNDVTDGKSNVAIGYRALDALQTGDENFALGANALGAVVSGGTNVAIGEGALGSVTSDANIGIGRLAGNLLTGSSARRNVLIGTRVFSGPTSGGDNVIIGGFAADFATGSPDENVIIGKSAGNNLFGNKNVFIGFEAGYNEVGGNKLYIHNIRGLPLIYGDFTSGTASVEITDQGDLASESLAEGDFATHAKWDVTNDFTDDVGNKAEWTWSANQTSLLTQTDGGNLAIDGVADSWYKFVYTVAVTTAPDGDAAATITTAFAASAQTLKLTAGTHTTYFKSAAAPTDFIISIVSGDDTEGQLSYDDLSLKQMVGGDFRVNGTAHMGDGVNYTQVDNAGDVTFVGGGGLVLGHMYIPGVDIIVPIGDADPEEVKDDGTTSLDDGWAAGELNLVTFPAGGDEHYLTVTKPGKYDIVWGMSFMMDGPGANIEVHGGIMIDDAAVRNKGEAHRTIANNNDTGHFGGNAIIDCPNGTEEISLWVLNADNNVDIIVEHGDVTITMIGGT